MERKDIFVYLEQSGGGLLGVGLEMLSTARNIAERYGGNVCGVLIGAQDAQAAAEKAISFGADIVYVITGEEYAQYHCDAFTAALTELANRHRPAALMIGATVNGRDLAPRVACRLQTGLTADVTGVGYNETFGCIDWCMPAYGGQMMADIICPEKLPQMGTIRPGAFEAKPVSGARADGKIVHEDIPFPKQGIRTQIVEAITKTVSGVDLREAEIIVSGGYGCRDAEGFQLVAALARALGAELGASRAAIDAGWTTEDRQIGQSGVYVRPKLYIACGISGAAQHTAGMDKSGTIIAINTEPDAPIFRIADYGVIEDLRTFLPALIAEIEKAAAV